MRTTGDCVGLTPSTRAGIALTGSDWVSCAASRHEANDLVSARPLLVFDNRTVPDNGFGKRIALVDKNGFGRDRAPDLVDRDPIFVASDLEFGPVPVRIGAAGFPGRRY